MTPDESSATIETMAINIKDPETEALIRHLATRTGASITESVRDSVVASLSRLPEEDVARKKARLEEIVARGRARAVRDVRSPEEIIGYDEHGLP